MKGDSTKKQVPTVCTAGSRVRLRGQSGVSLVEVLVVVTVLVPVVLAAALGLLTSAKLSTSTKVSQQLNAAAASYGESLKEITYQDCAYPDDYELDPELWAPPAGSDISASIVGVKYWDQTSGQYGASCSADQGTQEIGIHLTDVEGETDLTVVKRDPAGYPS